ncbi:MAG: hypothetical protein RLZZ450_4152 [Pseudomonadota bacterium]|jgi:hypothetical protein
MVIGAALGFGQLLYERFRRCTSTALLRFLLCVLVSSSAAQTSAQEVSEATRSEARERFERGLRLFNQNNTGAALAEFARAYELIANPVVLYNIALVQVALQRPVDAVTTFDKLLADAHSSLRPEELALARERRSEQAALVGELALEVDASGARIELDSFEVGQSPLASAVRVAAGEHTLSLVAPGFVPERRRLLVAGKQRVELPVKLTPLVGRLAYLTVHANVQGADVSVDGLVVGKTPLHSSLALAAGMHEVAVARRGYRGSSRAVAVGEGTTGELSLELQVDAAALATEGSTLELRPSESDCVVTLDGVPRGAYTEPIRLPPGPYSLRVERADFFPFERHIQLAPGVRTLVPVVFEPTAEKRVRYRDKAQRWRRAGFSTAGVGVVLLAAGISFVVYNKGAERDAKQKFDRSDVLTAGGDCSPGFTNAACNTEAELRLQHLDDVRAREKFGWIGLGVGGATLVTGLLVLLRGEDPKRYEQPQQTRVYALTPTGWGARASGGMGLSGRF